MTTYSAITAGQIDAESIFDTILAAQYANNVLAIAEGDATAPRIQGDNALTTPTTGANYRHAQVGQESTTSSTSYERLGAQLIIVPRTGVYQLSFEMKTNNPTFQATARVYRNPATAYGGEVALGTAQTSTSTSFVEKTEASVSLNAGDVLVVYASIANASYVASVQNFTLESNVKPMG